MNLLRFFSCALVNHTMWIDKSQKGYHTQDTQSRNHSQLRKTLHCSRPVLWSLVWVQSQSRCVWKPYCITVSFIKTWVELRPRNHRLWHPVSAKRGMRKISGMVDMFESCRSSQKKNRCPRKHLWWLHMLHFPPALAALIYPDIFSYVAVEGSRDGHRADDPLGFMGTSSCQWVPRHQKKHSKARFGPEVGKV